MQDIIIKIGAVQFIGLFITLAGILIAIAWNAGSRFAKLETAIEWIKQKFSDLEDKNANVAEAHSPLAPNEKGIRWIKGSGLEKYLDDHKSELIFKLKNLLPENYTEYEVQEMARKIMSEINDEELITAVKKFAYENGTSPEIILRVSGLWLRDDFLNIPRKTI